jgi:hypothetical protein
MISVDGWSFLCHNNLPQMSVKIRALGADGPRVLTRFSLRNGAGGGRLLISEHDIWDAALSMIGRYGFDAPLVAGDRSDTLTKDGKIDESETWQRILRAIVRLQAEKPGPGERVQ